MGHAQKYLEHLKNVADRLDTFALEQMAERLDGLREKGGRLFMLGVGGSAANASHAVNDFRKIAGIEAYCCTDNVSELSARINDEGWESSFADWLRASRLSSKDAVFVLSVGGGNLQKGVSLNIVAALRYAKEIGAEILGIVGRDGGYTQKVADACILVPTADESLVTFLVESFQSVLLHLMVSHPKLKKVPTKWEGITR